MDAVMEAITPSDAAKQRVISAIARVCGYGEQVCGSVIARFSEAADRRGEQEKAGRIFDHRSRALRSDLRDLACARDFWHNCELVRLDTFAGRCNVKVNFVGTRVYWALFHQTRL